MGQYFRIKMKPEESRGHRVCQLCEDPIKKGQKCFSMWVPGRQWTQGIHIHKKHLKAFHSEKCGRRAECVTGEYDCKSHLCKYRRTV